MKDLLTEKYPKNQKFRPIIKLYIYALMSEHYTLLLSHWRKKFIHFITICQDCFLYITDFKKRTDNFNHTDTLFLIYFSLIFFSSESSSSESSGKSIMPPRI